MLRTFPDIYRAIELLRTKLDRIQTAACEQLKGQIRHKLSNIDRFLQDHPLLVNDKIIARLQSVLSVGRTSSSGAITTLLDLLSQLEEEQNRWWITTWVIAPTPSNVIQSIINEFLTIMDSIYAEMTELRLQHEADEVLARRLEWQRQENLRQQQEDAKSREDEQNRQQEMRRQEKARLERIDQQRREQEIQRRQDQERQQDEERRQQEERQRQEASRVEAEGRQQEETRNQEEDDRRRLQLKKLLEGEKCRQEEAKIALKLEEERQKESSDKQKREEDARKAAAEMDLQRLDGLRQQQQERIKLQQELTREKANRLNLQADQKQSSIINRGEGSDRNPTIFVNRDALQLVDNEKRQLDPYAKRLGKELRKKRPRVEEDIADEDYERAEVEFVSQENRRIKESSLPQQARKKLEEDTKKAANEIKPQEQRVGNLSQFSQMSQTAPSPLKIPRIEGTIGTSSSKSVLTSPESVPNKSGKKNTSTGKKHMKIQESPPIVGGLGLLGPSNEKKYINKQEDESIFGSCSPYKIELNSQSHSTQDQRSEFDSDEEEDEEWK